MKAPTPRPWALFLVAALATVTAAAPADPPSVPAAREGGRLVVIGFDGADEETTAEMMDAGELPNLARLRDTGTFAGLRSTAPPESPVAWAALNTGRNPAETGIPGFVRNKVSDPVEDPETGETRPFGLPIPTFGHVEKDVMRPIDEISDVPIPTWDPSMLGGACFAAVFLAFFVVFGLLLKMSKGPAIFLSLVLGGAGGWAGYMFRGYLPEAIPLWVNPIDARNFWDYAADEGISSVVIDAAMTFDMEAPDGVRLVAGLGLPDARSGLGDWFIYTTDPLQFDRPPRGYTKGLTAGTIFKVDERDGRIETKLYGPINFWEAERMRAEVAKIDERLDAPDIGYRESFELQQEKRELEDRLGVGTAEPERVAVDLIVERDVAAGKADITIGEKTQELAEGEWSDWYEVRFQLNPLLEVNAVTRVKLVHLDQPHFELFVNTLDIDPAKPTFWQPVSQPLNYSAELAEACGSFETYGWPSLTMPYKDEKISVATMLEDLEFTMKWREKVIYHAIDQGDWELFFGVFSITDRVQHMMYQFYDEGHPMYVAEEANKEVTFFDQKMPRSEVIPDVYRQMDRIVGNVMEKIGDDDTLLLVADHGFESFRYQVHINNWLVKNGFLTLKEGIDKSAASTPSAYADWSKTQAYALGLGFIYLNRVGREKNGIVEDSEAREVMEAIKAKLLASTDPARDNAPIVTDVYITADEHGGEHLGKECDMMVGFAENYRVSWSTTQGGIRLREGEDGWVDGPVIVDNDQNWSGGHVSVDLEEVRGIFFSNRKMSMPEGGPDLLHVGPTALSVLGVEPPAEMDMPPLEFLN